MELRKKGALFMVMSALCFALMQIAIKASGDIPVMEQIFARNIISLLIALVVIIKSGGSLFGDRKNQPLLFARSFFGFAGLISMFYACAHANQADVTTLIKLSPFFIALLAAAFLKEKVGKVTIISMVLAFAGAIFVANPAFNSNIFPLLVAILCALFSSVSYTLLAYFKNRVSGMTIIMHFSTFSCVCSAIFMAGNFVVPDITQTILLLAIGVLGGLGQIFLTYSYRYAPASEVSIYNYTGIIFSGLFGFLFFGEVLKMNSIIGIGLVLAASVIVYKFS